MSDFAYCESRIIIDLEYIAMRLNMAFILIPHISTCTEFPISLS